MTENAAESCAAGDSLAASPHGAHPSFPGGVGTHSKLTQIQDSQYRRSVLALESAFQHWK